MNLLLDTHVVLWWLGNSPRLSPEYKKAIAASDSICHISAGTIWEISIKKQLGKLTLPSGYIAELKAQGFVELPLTWAHCEAVSQLPLIHKDPFDRIIIAQSQIEALTILSVDKHFRSYPVKLL